MRSTISNTCSLTFKNECMKNASEEVSISLKTRNNELYECSDEPVCKPFKFDPVPSPVTMNSACTNNAHATFYEQMRFIEPEYCCNMENSKFIFLIVFEFNLKKVSISRGRFPRLTYNQLFIHTKSAGISIM